jgi:hypothetical protein
MMSPAVTSALASAKRFIYPLTSTAVVKASLVEGTLKGGGPFRTLLVHNCDFNAQLKERSYEGDATVLRQWRILIPTLRGILRRRTGDFDLCVAVLPSFYDAMFRPLCDFKGREQVRQVIDTSIGWEEMRRYFVKKKRQISNNFAEKTGLSYRLSRDDAEFDHFYYRMHVPHIQRRYGHLSAIDSYATMRKFFRKGVLLFVTRGDEPVAGALSLFEGKTLVFRRTGVLDGDETHVKGGAQTALYYFQLRYAVDHGLRAVDAMKSAPFLNDGVFRHKAEWGARTLRDDEAWERVYYFARGPKDRIARFFDVNPVVCEDGAQLYGVVGDAPAGQLAAAPPADLSKRFPTLGLRDLVVYAPDGARTVGLTEEPDPSP